MFRLRINRFLVFVEFSAKMQHSTYVLRCWNRFYKNSTEYLLPVSYPKRVHTSGASHTYNVLGMCSLTLGSSRDTNNEFGACQIAYSLIVQSASVAVLFNASVLFF